jgi:hypothetical protein
MLRLDKFLLDLLLLPSESIFVDDLDRCLLLFNRREEMQKHLEFLRLKNFPRKLRVAPASIDIQFEKSLWDVLNQELFLIFGVSLWAVHMLSLCV